MTPGTRRILSVWELGTSRSAHLKKQRKTAVAEDRNSAHLAFLVLAFSTELTRFPPDLELSTVLFWVTDSWMEDRSSAPGLEISLAFKWRSVVLPILAFPSGRRPRDPHRQAGRVDVPRMRRRRAP